MGHVGGVQLKQLCVDGLEAAALSKSPKNVTTAVTTIRSPLDDVRQHGAASTPLMQTMTMSPVATTPTHSGYPVNVLKRCPRRWSAPPSSGP